MSFIKNMIKKTLSKHGYRIKRIHPESGKIQAKLENTPKSQANTNKIKKPPFDQRIYTPTWRIRNYYALKEFGPQIKRWFIEQRYTHALGTFPNLDNPKTFNEKLHWLNLYYHNPEITKCCDKYRLKNYVTEKIGSQYTVPVIKTYDRAAEINFSELPDQFAIKVNWGDGAEFLTVVSDKNKVNEDEIKFKFNNAMQPWNNLYYSHFFWGYKNVKPKIYVEEYLEHTGTDIDDYKFHCFNGEVKFVLVCEERSNNRMKKTFLDLEWKIMPCYRADCDVNYGIVRPDNFEEMIHVAQELCKPFPFVRVDLYNVNGRLYVGEMTFHPGCGLEKFAPSEYDYIIGDMLELPKEKMVEADERY